MGLWDVAADIKISREAHHTFHFSPFSFHFSPFTFQFSPIYYSVQMRARLIITFIALCIVVNDAYS